MLKHEGRDFCFSFLISFFYDEQVELDPFFPAAIELIIWFLPLVCTSLWLLLVTAYNMLEVSLGFHVILLGSAGLRVLVLGSCAGPQLSCVGSLFPAGVSPSLKKSSPPSGISLVRRCFFTGLVSVIVTGLSWG